MPNTKAPIVPEDFDDDEIFEETGGIESNDYSESDNIEIKTPEHGAISALQELSDRLSSIQREYIKGANLNALSSLANYLNQSLRPINTKAMTDYAKSISLVSRFDLQGTIKPVLSAYTSYIQSLNTPLLSDSILSAFEKIQLPAMAFSKIAIQTPMIEKLMAAIVNMDYISCFSIANETLNKPNISAPDVAFFKTTELAKAMRPQLVYPRGFSSSLTALNQSSAYTISDNSDIFYDVSQRGFLGSGQNNSVILSKELNVICLAKELIDSVEETFISERELMDFMSFLFDTPTFASNHPTGQKIYQFIQGLMNRDSEYKHGFDKEVYYHSRTRKAEDRPYINEEMLRAPIGVTGPGRYNNPGRSHYYFSDTAEGAETEVQKHNKDRIVQTVKLVPIRNIVLLDLSGTMRRGATFLRYLRFPLSSADDKTPREYLIPCYVADCCKRIGFDGIKYYGGKDYSNYVSWDDGFFKISGI